VETAGKLPGNLWKKIRNCCREQRKIKLERLGKKI
jgi:hypothetical protein